MAKVAAGNVPTVKITVRLPENVADLYAERAAKFGRDVEDEIFLRLRDCREHTATTPIYLNDDQRNELSQLSGMGIRTADDLLAWARKQSTLKLGEVSITLSTQLANRLSTRRFGASWEELLRRIVIENLEREVGLR